VVRAHACVGDASDGRGNSIRSNVGRWRNKADQDGRIGRFAERRPWPFGLVRVPGPAAKILGSQGDSGRYDQRRGVRRYHFGGSLYPFFLEGVATAARLNQADGLHPTAEGVDMIVKNILPTVEAFLGTISGQRS